MFPPRPVPTPVPTHKWARDGASQYAVNELVVNLEVRRAELDEDFAKIQIVVDVSILIEVILYRHA